MSDLKHSSSKPLKTLSALLKSKLKLKLQNQSIFGNSGSGSYIETNSWCCGASLTAKQTLEIPLYQQGVNQVFPNTLFEVSGAAIGVFNY